MPKDVFTETDLVMPGLVSPANLKRGGRFRSAPITSDIYNICTRLDELSPRLGLHWVKDAIAFVVTETDARGEEAIVMKYRKLTPEIINDVRYWMGVPLTLRAAECERRADKIEADAKDDHFGELYENMGRDMWAELERTGFTQRGVSFPKRHKR
jgi:hypothetical protein